MKALRLFSSEGSILLSNRDGSSLLFTKSSIFFRMMMVASGQRNASKFAFIIRGNIDNGSIDYASNASLLQQKIMPFCFTTKKKNGTMQW